MKPAIPDQSQVSFYPQLLREWEKVLGPELDLRSYRGPSTTIRKVRVVNASGETKQVVPTGQAKTPTLIKNGPIIEAVEATVEVNVAPGARD